MSEEQKVSFMQDLDRWTDENIVLPLFNTDANQDDWEEGVARVKQAIRQKVLQSYRNGRMTRTGGPENLPVARQMPVPRRA